VPTNKGDDGVNTTKRRAGALAGVLVLALAAVGCGDDDDSSTATTAGGATPTTAAAATSPGSGTTGAGSGTTVKVSGTIQGSGSTLQKAYEEEAADAFMKAQSGTTITYGGGGSGKGRTDLASKVVNYAGTDSPYKDTEKPADPILYFPILFSPITVSFNLSGLDELQLTPDTIAKIFSRTIKTWDDPAIKADNPDADLPSTEITVAHRSDGSGTTQNFTEYLAAAAPSSWTLGSGSTVEWPGDTQAGNGNTGVAQIISGTDGAVGYVDLSDAVAANLEYAKVKNQSGKFIEPTVESATAAGDGIEVKPDLTFSAVNTTAPEGYPITAPSWVMVYVTQPAGAGALVKAYVTYLIGDGQELLSDLDYAPISKSLQEKATAQLDQIKVG
jgi:phosphate transport system substrate-binding protein